MLIIFNGSIRPNTEYSANSAEYAEYQKLRENRRKNANIPSKLTENYEFFRQIKCKSSCSIKFDEFSVKSKDNELAVFNSHCGNSKNSLTHFWQKFRESNGFTKEITKWLI